MRATVLGIRALCSSPQAYSHTIFFPRFFPSILPQTREVLDLTLPYVADAERETMIDQRTSALVPPARGRAHSTICSIQDLGLVVVMAVDGGRFLCSSSRSGAARLRTTSEAKEEICWEQWTVKVTVAEPRTESGKSGNMEERWNKRPRPQSVYHLIDC